MRRYLGRLIPIVMLTVLVQFFAPVFFVASAANAYADPLRAAVICSASDSGEHGAPGVPNTHLGGCVSCAVGVGAPVALDVPEQAFVAIQRDYLQIVWLQDSETPAAIRIGPNAQARAPPVHS